MAPGLYDSRVLKEQAKIRKEEEMHISWILAIVLTVAGSWVLAAVLQARWHTTGSM